MNVSVAEIGDQDVWKTAELAFVTVAADSTIVQSRIAKMEAGDPSVSFDLLLKSLLSLGTSPKQLARVIGSL